MVIFVAQRSFYVSSKGIRIDGWAGAFDGFIILYMTLMTR